MPRALGQAWEKLQPLLAGVRSAHPQSLVEWKFAARAGWYRVQLLKERRLFYVLPKRGDFRLSIIVGDKALERVRQSAFAATLVRRLKTAKRYPEGTAFAFTPDDFDEALCVELIAAKVAS